MFRSLYAQRASAEPSERFCFGSRGALVRIQSSRPVFTWGRPSRGRSFHLPSGPGPVRSILLNDNLIAQRMRSLVFRGGVWPPGQVRGASIRFCHTTLNQFQKTSGYLIIWNQTVTSSIWLRKYQKRRLNDHHLIRFIWGYTCNAHPLNTDSLFYRIILVRFYRKNSLTVSAHTLNSNIHPVIDLHVLHDNCVVRIANRAFHLLTPSRLCF